MERFINLGNLDFIFLPVFPCENNEVLEERKKVFESCRKRDYINFKEVMLSAIKESGCVLKYDDSKEVSLDHIWNEFLKLMISGLDDNFLYEHSQFFKCPYEWAEVVGNAVCKKDAIELVRSLILAALGKAKGFMDMVNNMELFWLYDKPVYIYTVPDLMYHLAKPEDTGAEYVITIHDDYYSVERIDHQNICLNPEWINPLVNMEKLLAPLVIAEIDIPEKYEEMLNKNTFGAIDVVDRKEIRVSSFSDAIRIIQNLMV